MYIEYYVLQKYSLFFNLDINQISDFLYRNINSFNCSPCDKQKKIIPIYIPKIIKDIQYNKIKNNNIQDKINKQIINTINQKEYLNN